MWIRSQDRNMLINESYFRIYKERKGFSICSRIDVLGTYSTEEKAMKVIDMIHSRIEKTTKYYEKSLQFTYGSEYVFEMPEDEEVCIL